MGAFARIRRFELFERRVLHFGRYVFQTAKKGGWGVFLGILGRSWCAPVGHVTAALACYSRPSMLQEPLWLSYLSGRLVARCSWFVLASLFLAFQLVLLDWLSFWACLSDLASLFIDCTLTIRN